MADGSPLTRGLNPNHNRVLKDVFQGAATAATARSGPLQDCFHRMLARGMREELARVTLTRKLAALTLRLWKKGEHHDPTHLTQQAQEGRDVAAGAGRIPPQRLPTPRTRCGGQSQAGRRPGPVCRGTRLTVGPFARPEEASGRLHAESPIEPWSAIRDPSACERPSGLEVDEEVTDAKADCPAHPKAPAAINAPGGYGADRQGKEILAISGERVCP